MDGVVVLTWVGMMMMITRRGEDFDGSGAVWLGYGGWGLSTELYVVTAGPLRGSVWVLDAEPEPNTLCPLDHSHWASVKPGASDLFRALYCSSCLVFHDAA